MKKTLHRRFAVLTIVAGTLVAAATTAHARHAPAEPTCEEEANYQYGECNLQFPNHVWCMREYESALAVCRGEPPQS